MIAYDWAGLRDALFWLFEVYGYSLTGHETALKNALLSGEVPLRAHAPGNWAYQRIERYVTVDAEIRIFDDSVELTTGKGYYGGRVRTTYSSVQVDKIALRSWISANSLDNSSITPDSRSTSGGERELEKWLRRQPELPIPLKAEVWNAIQDGKDNDLGRLKGRISWKGLCRCWTSTAHSSWTRGGRRRSPLPKGKSNRLL